MSTSAGRPFTHGRRPAKRSLFGIVEIEADAGRAMMQTDITQPVDMNRVAEAVLAEFGQINILHNNAGVGELEDTTEARWHKIIDVNLSGAYRTCRRVIPAMQRQRRGAIVNISSVTGRLINRYPYFSYSAPKTALNHFTRAIAVRYAARGIRANVVSPSLMDTPMARRLPVH